MRIIFSVILSLFLMFNNAFATLPNPGNFIKQGLSGSALTTPELMSAMDVTLGKGLDDILKLLYKVGVAVAICVLVFMGIQLVTSSPQQKAQLKASLAPYFVGLLLFVAGVPIAILIINIIILIF